MKLENRVKEPERPLPYHGTIMTETVDVSPYYRIAGKFRPGGGGGGGDYSQITLFVSLSATILSTKIVPRQLRYVKNVQSAKLSSTKCQEPMICEIPPPPHEINPLYGMRVYYCMGGLKIHVLHNLSSNLHILSDIPQGTCQYSSSGLNIYLYSIIMHTHTCTGYS